MNKTSLEKIKKLLEDQHLEILEKSKLRSTADIDIDGDDTDEIQGKIIALANSQLISRDKEKLVKIQNAFRKIADGTFGTCEGCEEDISEKRLFVNPIFTTCISCAERIEIIRKKNGR